MFTILFLLLLSIGAGYLLRHIRFVQKVEQSSRYTILSLLFVFGISIGSDKTLLTNIAQLGWRAVIIALLGIVGSMLAALLFQHVVERKKGGTK